MLLANKKKETKKRQDTRNNEIPTPNACKTKTEKQKQKQTNKQKLKLKQNPIPNSKTKTKPNLAETIPKIRNQNQNHIPNLKLN
jgi:hypothetical protein